MIRTTLAMTAASAMPGETGKDRCADDVQDGNGLRQEREPEEQPSPAALPQQKRAVARAARERDAETRARGGADSSWIWVKSGNDRSPEAREALRGMPSCRHACATRARQFRKRSAADPFRSPSLPVDTAMRTALSRARGLRQLRAECRKTDDTSAGGAGRCAWSRTTRSVLLILEARKSLVLDLNFAKRFDLIGQTADGRTSARVRPPPMRRRPDPWSTHAQARS